MCFVPRMLWAKIETDHLISHIHSVIPFLSTVHRLPRLVFAAPTISLTVFGVIVPERINTQGFWKKKKMERK